MLFDVIRQVTATCPSTRAHWRHLANTIELVYPSAHSSPQSKRQMDRFSRFCIAYGRKCLYFTMGAPIYQNCPFPWGSGPPMLHVMLLAHASPQPKRHLVIMVCLFHPPLKITPSHVGIWTSCNTWFIGPTRVWNANGNLIVSAFFAGHTSVTNWQSHRKTDKQTTLLGAMRRNNA